MIKKYTSKTSKYSSSEVITPHQIVTEMVTLLPSDDYRPDARYLDPAVKSGKYLKELYKRIFDNKAMKQAFPDETQRHDHILKNLLYSLATSPFAEVVSRKELYNNITTTGNIHYVDEYR